MLIKANGSTKLATNDFASVPDGEPLPVGSAVVSLKRFMAERDSLLARNAPLGVRIETGESPEVLGADVHKLAVIVLHVPYFKDGRAFSWARLLRTRLGYTGELRVSGHVLQDQLAFFARVGVDAFELKDGLALSDVDAALHAISVVYQPSVDGKKTAYDLRKATAHRPH